MDPCIETKNLTKSLQTSKCANVLSLAQGMKPMKAVSLRATLEHVWEIVILLVGLTVIWTGLSVNVFRWE